MTYILYHASCRDGFAAAYTAWKKFGNKAKYIPVKYGDPPPKMKDGSSVYILDFSYPREVLEELHKRMKFILVIDHHKTAKEELEDLDYTIFNMDRSGCALTWAYFFPVDDMPDWMKYIEDRDIWAYKYEDTDAVTEAIRTYPYDFITWDNFEVIDLKHMGEGIVRFKNSYVKSVIRTPVWTEILDYKVPAINTGIFVSDVANALCEEYPESKFAACYFDMPDKRVWSLRSIGDFDVSAVAKANGGGGHRNAAGFYETDIFG